MSYDVTSGAGVPDSVWITKFEMDLAVPDQHINSNGQTGFVFVWPGFGTSPMYNTGYPTGTDIVGYGVLQPVLTYGQVWPNPNNANAAGHWWISGQAVGYNDSVYQNMPTANGNPGWGGGDILVTSKGATLHIVMSLQDGFFNQTILDKGTGNMVAWPFNMSENANCVGQGSAAFACKASQQKQNAAQLFIENVLGPPTNNALFSNIKIYTNIANAAYCKDTTFSSADDYIHAVCTGSQYNPSQNPGESYCHINQCNVYANPVIVFDGLTSGISYTLSHWSKTDPIYQTPTLCRSGVTGDSVVGKMVYSLPFNGFPMRGCTVGGKPDGAPTGPYAKQFEAALMQGSDGSVHFYHDISFDSSTGVYQGTRGPVSGFSGVFSPTNWQAGSNPPRPNLVNFNSRNTEVVLTNYSAWAVSGATLGTVMPVNGSVTFDYQTTNVTNDCPASYSVDGKVSILPPSSDAPTTVEVQVSGGKGFAFALNGQNQPDNFGCRANFTSKSFKISNFKFTSL